MKKEIAVNRMHPGFRRFFICTRRWGSWLLPNLLHDPLHFLRAFDARLMGILNAQVMMGTNKISIRRENT